MKSLEFENGSYVIEKDLRSTICVECELVVQLSFYYFSQPVQPVGTGKMCENCLNFILCTNVILVCL